MKNDKNKKNKGEKNPAKGAKPSAKKGGSPARPTAKSNSRPAVRPTAKSTARHVAKSNSRPAAKSIARPAAARGGISAYVSRGAGMLLSGVKSSVKWILSMVKSAAKWLLSSIKLLVLVMAVLLVARCVSREKEPVYTLGKNAKFCDETTGDRRYCTMDGRLVTGRVMDFFDWEIEGVEHKGKRENTVKNGQPVHMIEYWDGVKKKEYDMETGGFDSTSLAAPKQNIWLPSIGGGYSLNNEKTYYANGRLRFEFFDHDPDFYNNPMHHDKNEPREARIYDESGRLVFSSVEIPSDLIAVKNNKDAWMVKVDRIYPVGGRPGMIGYFENPDQPDETHLYMDEDYNKISGLVSYPDKNWKSSYDGEDDDTMTTFAVKDGVIEGTKKTVSKDALREVVYAKGRPVKITESWRARGDAGYHSTFCGKRTRAEFNKTETLYIGGKRSETYFKDEVPVMIACKGYRWGSKNAVQGKDYFCAKDIPAGKTILDLCK
jgi:hypothetical protein